MITTTNYHGEKVTFAKGDAIVHVDDEGVIHAGTVLATVDDDALEIRFADGDEGTESARTCYHPDEATDGAMPEKRDVSGGWETVATYGSTYSDGDSMGACDVEVQIAEHEGYWFIKTTDDAGGSDEAPDTAYESETAAREAAEELAEQNDECDGLSADDWLEREKEQAIESGKDADGEWVLAHKDGSRWDADRYSSREAAELAIGAWYDRVQAANPGTNIIWHLMDTPELARLNDAGEVEIVGDESE